MLLEESLLLSSQPQLVHGPADSIEGLIIKVIVSASVVVGPEPLAQSQLAHGPWWMEGKKVGGRGGWRSDGLVDGWMEGG